MPPCPRCGQPTRTKMVCTTVPLAGFASVLRAGVLPPHGTKRLSGILPRTGRILEKRRNGGCPPLF